MIEPGAMAEFVKVKKRAVEFDTLRLPEGMTYEEGALIEPVACSVKAVKRAGVPISKRILVIGLGFMGLVNALLSKYYGAEVVAGLDLVDWRIEKAKEMGIEFVENPRKVDELEWAKEITKGKLFDSVIVGPGIPEVVENSLKFVAKGGILLIFTPTEPSLKVKLDFFDIYMKEIRIVPSYSAGPVDTREALRIIAEKVLPFEKMITHRFRLEEAHKAYRLLKSSKETLKIMVIQ
jgi:L-iditol 2-dehydrogenase